MKIVRWLRKNLIAPALAILFALGVLCASLSSPTGAFTSQMPDCSESGSVLDHPCQALLCNLGASRNAFAHGARSYDFAKNGRFLLGGVVPLLSHDDILLAGKRLPTAWSDYCPAKIPVHLFNSVLTL